MSDLISRQAAIDALDVLCQEHRYRIPGKRETYSQYNEAWQDALGRAECAIGELPSAKPDVATDINVGDIVNRKGVFIPDITVEMFRNASLDSVEDLMASGEMEDILLPSAQPEVLDCGSGELVKDSQRLVEASSNDMISRQQAIDEIKEIYEWHDNVTKERIIEHFERLPSAHSERKKGKWILIKGSNGKLYHKCSECLHTQEITGVKNYCAVCGADMRGENNE